MPDISNNGNDHALQAQSTLEKLNVDDDFLSQLKGAYSACNFFSNENIERRKRPLIEKSSIGRIVSVSRSCSDTPSITGFNLSTAN